MASVQRAGGCRAVWRRPCRNVCTYLGGTCSLTEPLSPSAALLVLHPASVWRRNKNSHLESASYPNAGSRACRQPNHPARFLPVRGNGVTLSCSASLAHISCHSSTQNIKCFLASGQSTALARGKQRLLLLVPEVTRAQH